MSSAPAVVHDFSVDKKRVNRRALKKARAGRPLGTRTQPPVVVFAAQPGSPGVDLPPVRIFLGTEPLQYKAERVFLFSVAKHRNPDRRYEVYLMKDLAGYDRKGWATGFTKYRFAIPYMAGGTGRAIYNDVDQIYLADPAELFDRDMDGAALLAIDQHETSVMLMDCEKLAKTWQIDTAADSRSRLGTAEAVHGAGQWGIMPGIWNARDTEYVAGESKVLHFTTLDTQPWKPFPQVYQYRANANEDVWQALKTEADATRYLPYTRENPGPRFAALDRSATGPARHDHGDPIAQLSRTAAAKTLLYCGPGRLDEGAWPDMAVTQGDPLSLDKADPVDAVALVDVLDRLPEEDIPWVLDEAFALARGAVYVSVACCPAPDGDDSAMTVLPPEWWRGQMETMSAMHPHISWELHAPSRSETGLMGKIRAAFGSVERFSHTAPSST